MYKISRLSDEFIVTLLGLNYLVFSPPPLKYFNNTESQAKYMHSLLYLVFNKQSVLLANFF